MSSNVSFNSNVPVIREANLNNAPKINETPKQPTQEVKNEINTDDKASFQNLKTPSFDPEKSQIKFGQKEEVNETPKSPAMGAILSFLFMLASGDASPESLAVVQNQLSQAAQFISQHGVPSESVKLQNESERFKKMSESPKNDI